MKIDRPLWAGGALLSQQQFQQQSRWEAWTNECVAHLSRVHPWGVQAARFDPEALRLGKLKASALRVRLDGLDGLAQGLNVMETLVAADANPWPRGLRTRADILKRLFVLLQAALRSTALDARDLPRLGLIDRQLAHLHQTLIGKPAGTVNSLEGLRQQIARLACRTEGEAQERARREAHTSIKLPDPHAAEDPAAPGSAQTIESATQPDSKPGKPVANRRRLAWLACLGTALLVLLAAFTGR
jgi:type VI secretion system protein ImpJ